MQEINTEMVKNILKNSEEKSQCKGCITFKFLRVRTWVWIWTVLSNTVEHLQHLISIPPGVLKQTLRTPALETRTKSHQAAYDDLVKTTPLISRRMQAPPVMQRHSLVNAHAKLVILSQKPQSIHETCFVWVTKLLLLRIVCYRF